MMTLLQQNLLLINTASDIPTLAIKKNHTGELIIQTSLEIIENKNNEDINKPHRDKVAFIVNVLDKLLEKSSLNIQDINAVAFCEGPGAFSALRAGVLIASLFNLFNPEIKIYKFSTAHMIFLCLINSCSPFRGLGGSIYLKAGLNGYFKESYDLSNLQIIDPVKLVQEITEKENNYLYIENFLQFDHLQIISKMSEVFNASTKFNPEDFLVTDSKQIKPNYVRPVSVTKSKKKK